MVPMKRPRTSLSTLRSLHLDLDQVSESQAIDRAAYQRLKSTISYWDVLSEDERQVITNLFNRVRQGLLRVVDRVETTIPPC